MSDRTKPKKLPPERVMADWILRVLGGREFVACVRGQLRAYRDGHWPEANVPGLLRQIYDFDETIREREAKAAISIAHTLTDAPGFGRTPHVEPRDDPKRQRVCLTNGTLNLRTGLLEPWSSEHELLHQLNFDWDDEAKCPIYDDVIERTLNFNDTAIALWEEFCGLSLVDDTSFQMLLFLKGPGGNGKGTIARVLRNMHDPSAVGSVAITDLNDERKRTSLVGKLVNISGEQSRLNVVSDTYLKKITGGDPIDIRRLYGETQNNVVLSVRFLELVNDMPATSDYSQALRRRIVILPCPNRVDNPDPDLDRKLYLERPGILRRWVAGLHRLYARGHFDPPVTSHQEVEEYMLENDPIRYWLQERCIPDQDKPTPSRELYGDFHEWEKLMGYRFSTPEIVWGRRLTNLGYHSHNIRLPRGAFGRVRYLRLNEGSGRGL
jgi:putative DNA primase/helicase